MARSFHHQALLRTRLELGLTQEQAAAAVGVDVRTYRRYEAGEVNDPREGFSIRSPSRRRLLTRMCEEFGLSEADLLVEAEGSPAPRADAPPVTSPDSAEPTSAAPLFRPLRVHALQRARHFVGREGLLGRLSAWARASTSAPGVLALVGVGGAGKTAAVERFLEGLGDGPRPHGVFVWSFYDDPRTEAFLGEAARYFGGVDPPPGERLARLEDALRRGGAHLVVLDGLETVQEEGGGGRAHGELADPLLRRLLCALARGLGQARALVTSRFELADLAPWADAGAETIRMHPLSDGEAAELLRRWGVRGGEGAVGLLLGSAGGHALSVAVIGSYVGTFLDGDPATFRPAALAEAARDEPLARRLAGVLSAYAEALPPGERDLVARLSVMPAGADESSLLTLARAGGAVAGQTAGWGTAEVRRGLARLERLGLVFRASAEPPRWSTHPFVREHFRALLGVSPGELHQALQPSTTSTLSGMPRFQPTDAASLDLYEAMLGRLLESNRPIEAFAVYARALGGFDHLGLVAGEMSRGARLVRAFTEDDDPRRFLPSLPAHARARLAYDRGLYAGALGDLVFASHCYEAHNALVETLQEPASIVTGLRTLAYTERLRGQLGDARGHVERSVALAEAAGLTQHVVRGLALLGALFDDLGELDEAERSFARLRALGDLPEARRGLWEAEHRLARGERREAAELTRRNIEVCTSRGWEGHAAHGCVVLGLAVVAEAPDEAATLLERARAWVARSGEVEMALRCHELAAHVALARGDAVEATRAASEGARIAELCGFEPLAGRFAALVTQAAARARP